MMLGDTAEQQQMIQAVILAGGRGTRLAPYTTILPKPLMPIGDMPVLEILIRRLKQSGILRVTLAVGYLSSLLRAYLDAGQEHLGMTIKYSQEQEPLGTAGPIRLIPELDHTFLVANGDLLTDLDFGDMIAFHKQHGAIATVGIYERDVQIELGVIETNAGQRVTAYVEKPVYHYNASMGVYVLEPAVLGYIPDGRHFDLPELICALLAANEPVVAYRHTGYWLDIGRAEDYLKAQEDYPMLSERLLGTGKGPKSPP